MKRSFFQATVVSILLYGCTSWTLTKRLEKKLEANYSRMLQAILNKSWRQQPTKHQLYGHLPPITKTIQVRRARHAGHSWRSRDKIISDVLLWTPTYGWAKAGQPTRTYIHQFCEDTGCSSENLPDARNDREKWRERVTLYPCWRHDMMMMMVFSWFLSDQVWRLNWLKGLKVELWIRRQLPFLDRFIFCIDLCWILWSVVSWYLYQSVCKIVSLIPGKAVLR